MLASCIGIVMLILDSRTALQAMQDGIQMCIQTTIPALFPMMVLTAILTSALLGRKLPFMTPLRKICGIPEGGESLLLTGLVGGYPVGAKCVAQAYKDGSISRQEARRLLGFCSNAGPAFIFGITGRLFSKAYISWLLWGIHIVSSLLVGFFLPGKRSRNIHMHPGRRKTLQSALSESLKAMGIICGWTVWLGVVCAFLKRWILWMLPPFLHTAALGMLELVNGCYSLLSIQQEGARLILCSLLLSFGGLCVYLQTAAFTQATGTGLYFPGKVLQSILSGLLAFAVQFLFFEPVAQLRDPAWFVMLTLLLTSMLIPYFHKWKKSVAFSGKVVYNR